MSFVRFKKNQETEIKFKILRYLFYNPEKKFKSWNAEF